MKKNICEEAEVKSELLMEARLGPRQVRYEEALCEHDLENEEAEEIIKTFLTARKPHRRRISNKSNILIEAGIGNNVKPISLKDG